MVHVLCGLLLRGSFPAELKVQFTFDGSTVSVRLALGVVVLFGSVHCVYICLHTCRHFALFAI